MRLTSRRLLALLLLGLVGCGSGHPGVPVTLTPESLSDWHLLRLEDGFLVPEAGTLPYDLNTPLFSDYAHKLRTVWMPEGEAAQYSPDDTFGFPVGTVITKTFYYPQQNGELHRVGASPEFSSGRLDLSAVKLVETRVLVKRKTGWEGLPYVWNDSGTEATLSIAGAIKPLSLDGDAFNYVVPTKNECASCHASNHTTAELKPIGPKARHLNKVFEDYASGPDNQLDHWEGLGMLAGLPPASGRPAAASWPGSPQQELTALARAYLDINCGHCHNPVGPADTSGLFLDASETSLRRLGLCKPPIAAGRGSGGREVSILPGNKAQSILYFRMQSRDPAAMMPEIGRSLVHREGVELVGRWIDAMPGGCGQPAD